MNIQTAGQWEAEGSPVDGAERGISTSLFRFSMLWTPEREAPSAWVEHVPFAFWLVDVLRPQRIVELGTHTGVSYSAMCQAVKTLGLATSCFAIDTWKGDEHAGLYGEDVYSEFAAFHDRRYSAFSRMIRSTFDEALHHFEDGSIDLLHIDGLHTYEAVRHDYEAWLPKLAANAVVLLHDINVRERDFGVFRLWNEITAGRLHFDFLHGHGLGVLVHGQDYPDALRALFGAGDDKRLVGTIRETFATLGHSVRTLAERRSLDQSLSEHAKELDRLRKALAEREGEFNTLRTEFHEREGEFDKLRTALHEREHELGVIGQRLSDTDTEIATIRTKSAVRDGDVNSLNATICALRASTSWRITAPLRAAKGLPGRLAYSEPVYSLMLALQAVTTRSRAPLRNWRAERVIARSGLFDIDWYLKNNPDVQALGMNPIRHYVVFGAKEGRDPSPSFSTGRYLLDNADVAAAGINPLVHYILHGNVEGRGAGEFVQYRFDKNIGLTADDDVLIYVAFCSDGLLTPLQIRTIEDYASDGYRVMLVVNSGRYNHMVDPGQTPAVIQIVRENIGFDFGAWAHATRLLGGLEAVRSVTFTNDSVIRLPPRVGDVRLLSRIDEISADAVFMTKNLELHEHLQSYFFAFKRQALAKGALQEIQRIDYLEDKQQVIDKEERTLSSRLERRGILTGVAFPCAEADLHKANPTIHHWRTLVDNGFPFFKVALVSTGILSIDSPEINEVLGSEFIGLLGKHVSRRVVSETFRSPDPNLPAQPALAIKGRFSESKALQAYNPAARQVPLVIVPFDDVEKTEFEQHGDPTILAIIHCFYLDEANELLGELAALQLNLRAVLTTDTEMKAAKLNTLLLQLGLRGEVVVAPNQGRDLAPFLIEGARHLRDEAIILHLHTKKSLHNSDHVGWAQFLRKNLIGSRAIVRSILHLLQEDEIGIVYSDHFDKVRDLRNWGYDFPHAQRLVRWLGVKLSSDGLLDFPTGSMFWAKTEALRPLFNLKFSYEDFEIEKGQIDGTLAHAIERCILLVAEHRGFRHIKVTAADNQAGSAMAITLDYRSIPYMLRRHAPRLLGGTGPQPASYPAVNEIYPVNVARSAKPGRRLNIIIPSMKPAQIYGGVTSAIRFAKALFEAMKASEIRVIVTSDNVDEASMRECASRLNTSFALVEPNDDVGGAVVVDLNTRRYLPLTIRAEDVFFATAWWTADLAFRLRDRQNAIFGTANSVIYLIQDYEPGFYSWSNQYALAQATYTRGDHTIALFNTEELANFIIARHCFNYAFHVPYTIDCNLAAWLKPTVKKPKIIVYGRPTVARNLFWSLVEGICVWQSRNPPINSSYQIVFAGEEFSTTYLEKLENARVVGKLDLKGYAELLNDAAIGISLMLSPHPSYPPLEMAAAGCITITNGYEGKDLTQRADNIISLGAISPENLADALDAAVGRVNFSAVTPLAMVRDIVTKVPRVDYNIIADLLDQGPATKVPQIEVDSRHSL